MANRLYLQQLGQSWYLRVKVPAELRVQVGNTHIRRALHTRDLDEANRCKWIELAKIHAHFDSLRRGVSSSIPAVQERALPKEVAPTTMSWTPKNLRPHGGLDSLAEEWSLTSTSKTVQFQRRQVYQSLRTFLDANLGPDDVSEAQAAIYVDDCLCTSHYSLNTRRYKLSALKAFWSWMGSRRYSTQTHNPWRGLRLMARDEPTRIKRPYGMPELVTLFSGQPKYPALREVMALGLFTGARIDEICSLMAGDVTIERGIAFLRISKSKTRAGIRRIAIAHPTALKIVRARHKAASGATEQLFSELRGGGYDGKLSWHVGQAFRYHRNGRGLTGETDFHSLRRTFITRLENLGVDQVRIARYVGHSLPTLAFKVYSGGATEATQRATARAIHYPREVERAVDAFLFGTSRN